MVKRVRRVVLLAAASLALLHVPLAHATLVVPMPAEDLAADADAIVTGHVTRIVSHWDPQIAQIVTTIAIAVDDLLKGELDDHEVVITQPGGTIGTVGSWMDGSPEFEVGEKVLVFLAEQPDGSVRVLHLYLGKYSIQPDEWTGGELAVRDPNPAGVHVLPGPRGELQRPGPDASDLHDFKARIARNAYRYKLGKRLSAERMQAAIAPEVSQPAHAFKFYPEPARWWEPDIGQPVSVKTYVTGEPLAPTKGFDQIRAAMSAWSTVPGSSFRYSDGGTTTSLGITMDGVNAVSFRDPLGQIGSGGWGCRGILAVGGHFFVRQGRIVNGQAFNRIVEADLITNTGWFGCGFYEDFENFSEVLTHEMGHMLGFDHSSDKSATMYATAHFDGRGASLGVTDKAGMVFTYPASSSTTPQTYTLAVVRAGSGGGSVASSPAGITCGSDCSEPYAQSTGVDLTPTAVAGSHFTGWSGACTGTGACHVTMSANLSVTANFALDSTGGTGGTGGSTAGMDLTVSTVSLLDTSTPRGGALRVSDTVTNVGAVAAKASQVVYYLSTTPQRTSSSIRLVTVRSVSPLAPGASSTGQTTLYAKVSAGSYRVIACADGNRQVAEGNENNNCAATSTVVKVSP